MLQAPVAAAQSPTARRVLQVSVVEYQRVYQVLTALSGVDPAAVGAECQMKPDQCNIFKAMLAPGSALGVLLAKEPAALTLEDAVTAGLAYAPQAVHWSTSLGIDGPIRAGGLGTFGELARQLDLSRD